MQLKEIVELLNKSKKNIYVSSSGTGEYLITAEISKDAFISCTTRNGEIRSWKNVDTLLQQLQKNKFRCKLILDMNMQLSMY